MLEADQSFAYAFFKDEPSAAKAVQNLINAGFDTEHVGVLMRGEKDAKELTLKHKTAIGPGLAIGGILGAAIGAAALPAAGLVAFGGAFAGLSGAAMGGATGTLMGTLGGLGFWKDEVAFPKEAFERGDVMVGTLTSTERADNARAQLSAAGARETKLSTHGEAERDLMDGPRSH